MQIFIKLKYNLSSDDVQNRAQIIDNNTQNVQNVGTRHTTFNF
jgi:hypothetical protein